MMQVVVLINGREIASATAINRSNLADVSSYQCAVYEDASKFSPGLSKEFTIDGHERNQSCWQLVEKMAREAA